MKSTYILGLVLCCSLVSPMAALAGDIPDCDAGEKLCRIEHDEYICIPFGHNCPLAEEIRTAFRMEVEGDDVEPRGQDRAIREVSLVNQGCTGCRNSKLVELPGNVQDVLLLSSRLVGGVSKTEVKTFGNLIFERSCFGFGNTLCGSVARRYLVDFEVEPQEPDGR